MRLVPPAVLVAVALRLAVVALAAPEQERVFNADSYDFEQLAVVLGSTGHFSRDEAPPFHPEGIRTPLYPALIALVYAVLPERYAAVLILQALLAGLVALALHHAHPDWGPGASWLYALDPTSIVYSSLVVAETLFTALLLAGILLLARALSGEARRPRIAALLAGLALGLAVLAKPAAAYLPAALLLGAALLRLRRLGIAATAVLLLLGWAAAVAPWIARNHAALGVAEVSTIQEINLLFWNTAVLEGGLQGLDFRSAERALVAEVERRAGREFDAIGEAERARIARGIALERIRAHPAGYAWVHLRGALATLADPGRLDDARLLGGVDWSFGFLTVLTREGVAGVLRAMARRPSAIVVLLALTGLWLAFLYSATFRGLWRLGRGVRCEPLIVLAVATAAYLALIGGPIGNARFRVPLVPYLAIFASAGLVPVLKTET